MDALRADAAGRNLTYKILVKDQAVSCVLTKYTHSVAPAVHSESVCPALGSLVLMPGGRIARVEGIPIGLVVTSNPRSIERSANPPAAADSSKHQEDASAAADTDSSAPASGSAAAAAAPAAAATHYAPDREHTCLAKHPQDLPGLLHVRVLYDGKKLQPPPGRCLAIAVCRVRVASEAQLKPYRDAQSALRKTKDELLLNTLSSLEALVAAGAQNPEVVEPEVLNGMRASVRSLLADAEWCPAGQTAPIKARFEAASRAMRLTALAKRVPSSPPTSAAAATGPAASIESVSLGSPAAPAAAAASNSDRKTTRTPPTSRLLAMGKSSQPK